MIFHSTYNKPILLVGNGLRSADAHDLLIRFSNKTHMPILTTMVGVDLLQGSNHIGFIGTHGNRVANLILESCDLIISIGARLSIRQVGKNPKNFAPNAKLVRVDIDYDELSRDIKKDELKLCMDAKIFLTNLLNEPIPDYSDWLNTCLKAKKLLKTYDFSEGNKVVLKISDLLPEDPIIAVDVGQNQCWCAQTLELKGTNGRILIGGGYGTMGCGLPYAIGASIAINKQDVYCMTGDGGFQMNIQELETVVREQLPIKIFILNNRVLGKISETQHKKHNDRFAQTTQNSGYSVPNFEKIAKAYGLRAITIDSESDFFAIKSFVEEKGPCLVNIIMSEDSVLVPKISWDTGIIEPKLPLDVYTKIKEILDS